MRATTPTTTLQRAKPTPANKGAAKKATGPLATLQGAPRAAQGLEFGRAGCLAQLQSSELSAVLIVLRPHLPPPDPRPPYPCPSPLCRQPRGTGRGGGGGRGGGSAAERGRGRGRAAGALHERGRVRCTRPRRAAQLRQEGGPRGWGRGWGRAVRGAAGPPPDIRFTPRLRLTPPPAPWVPQDAPRGHPDCLTGKTFVITGILDSLHRAEAEDLIKRHGGKVGAGVRAWAAALARPATGGAGREAAGRGGRCRGCRAAAWWPTWPGVPAPADHGGCERQDFVPAGGALRGPLQVLSGQGGAGAWERGGCCVQGWKGG